MSAPSLGMLETARKLSDRQRRLFHGAQIRIHTLANIQPFLLRSMRCERSQFYRVRRSGVHKQFRADRLAQSIAMSVWHCVINRDVAFDGCPLRCREKIWHSARE